MSFPIEPLVHTIDGATLKQWRRSALQHAAIAQIAPTELDWLLNAWTGLDRGVLRLECFDRQVVALSLSFEEIQQRWQQRIVDRVPVQYLVGSVTWRNLSLLVSPDVLIPRPETEGLIDLAAALSTPDLQAGHWADLGTGTGAIAITLADLFPEAKIHAVDISPEAIAIARSNAQLNHCDRINFYTGRWLEPLASLQGQLSGLVSNPPYIPSSIVLTLQPEVQNHEPHLALDGGEDGLDCLRTLVETGALFLRSGGVWLVELMDGQAQTVQTLLQQNGQYCKIRPQTDLAGVERFVSAQRC